MVSGSSLIVSGWSGPRTTIEFFADPPDTQGRTYIASLDEGGAGDLDSTTSSYGPGPINGVSQGSDTTDRFQFFIPLPPGLQAGSVLTATATDTGAPGGTSEFGGAAPVQFVANVRITKTGPPAITPGTTVSYSLVITNDGPSAASGVSVDDPTPPGLTFVSNSGACTTPFPCAIGTLQPGQSVSIAATFTVPAGYTTPNPIVNTATVSSQATEPDLTDNTATVNTMLAPPTADLAIAKGRPLRMRLGANLTYNIVVTNHGPSDAPNATVADPTPVGLMFVSNSGACTTAFPCSLGPLPVGQSRTIASTFLVPSGYAGPDPIVNMATVSSTAFDPDLTNNAATAETAIGPLFTVNVEITKSGPASVTPGTTLVYAITATNNGTLDVTDVTVSDPTPAGLTFISNAGACTTPFPCSLGTMPAGQSRQITAAFFVPSGYSSPNPISNTSTVTTTAADQDPTDNQATVTTSVSVPSADLFITKAGPASVTPPMNVTYVVQVTNNGPGDATGVTVSDATPGGLAFVGNTGDCPLRSLAPGHDSRGREPDHPDDLRGPVGIRRPWRDHQHGHRRRRHERSRPRQQHGDRDDGREPGVGGSDDHQGWPGRRKSGRHHFIRADGCERGPHGRAGRARGGSDAGRCDFVSNSGACTTPFPCSLGTLAFGEVRTIIATFRVGDAAAGLHRESSHRFSVHDRPAPANNTSSSSPRSATSRSPTSHWPSRRAPASSRRVGRSSTRSSRRTLVRTRPPTCRSRMRRPRIRCSSRQCRALAAPARRLRRTGRDR